MVNLEWKITDRDGLEIGLVIEEVADKSVIKNSVCGVFFPRKNFNKYENLFREYEECMSNTQHIDFTVMRRLSNVSAEIDRLQLSALLLGSTSEIKIKSFHVTAVGRATFEKVM